MKAKIQTYNPKTGYCSIALLTRTYELEDIQKVIDEYIAYKNLIIPAGPYIDSMAMSQCRFLCEKIEEFYSKLIKNQNNLTGVLSEMEEFIGDINTPKAVA